MQPNKPTKQTKASEAKAEGLQPRKIKTKSSKAGQAMPGVKSSRPPLTVKSETLKTKIPKASKQQGSTASIGNVSVSSLDSEEASCSESKTNSQIQTRSMKSNIAAGSVAQSAAVLSEKSRIAVPRGRTATRKDVHSTPTIVAGSVASLSHGRLDCEGGAPVASSLSPSLEEIDSIEVEGKGLLQNHSGFLPKGVRQEPTG